MSPRRSFRFVRSSALVCALLGSVVLVAACKRADPPPDPLKTQRDALERAKGVGDTMQKGVDVEARKADGK